MAPEEGTVSFMTATPHHDADATHSASDREAPSESRTEGDEDARPTTTRRSVASAAGGLVGLAALSGLGRSQEGTETGTETGTGTADGQQLDKRIGMLTASNGRNFYTVPIRWIEPGTTVVWQLVQGSHSSTAYADSNDAPQRIPEQASGWDSDVLSESGATFEQTFDVSGVYDYYCKPHQNLGMVGRLVVGTPDLATEPALAAPQESIPTAAAETLSALNAITTATFGST